MKKVLFCIVCLNMALLCFGQPVKIKLVAEREAFVVFGNERYDLKKGETRWITLEGEDMYGKRLLANEECFLFLEAGDFLEVVLHENRGVELKDDGSLCADRNNWLRKVDLLKQRLQFTKTVEEFMKQLVSFAGGRVLTLVIEEIMLLILNSQFSILNSVLKILLTIKK